MIRNNSNISMPKWVDENIRMKELGVGILDSYGVRPIEKRDLVPLEMTWEEEIPTPYQY